MAKAKRKAARKSKARGRSTRQKPGTVKISRSRITFSLTPAEVARAKRCLEESGSIRIGFKELRVTRLPTVLDDGKLID
jgi:hypothetical protein